MLNLKGKDISAILKDYQVSLDKFFGGIIGSAWTGLLSNLFHITYIKVSLKLYVTGGIVLFPDDY
jgi:hypothetical protein